MLRKSLIFVVLLALAACSTPEPRFGPDGRPLPQVYRINNDDTAEIQFRMLDGVNALREARGAAPVNLNSELTAAAKTHARDMSVQNRPWHFGSDGSSPLDRVQRVGYSGRLIGENISETFETELETLAAWMETQETREVILDPRARDLGFSWYQESSGKIWWTLVTGAPRGSRPNS
ncbi:MAG: CAP domain-containing protein [Pseudomonadota bacterium]